MLGDKKKLRTLTIPFSKSCDWKQKKPRRIVKVELQSCIELNMN